MTTGDITTIGSLMSRSRRKTPIAGITLAHSDQPWKADVARRLRRRVKQELKSNLNTDRFPGKRWDLVNPWDAPKDGKHYMRQPNPKLMRK